jgi:diguanylate cyclase (GGDEF)-like protein
MPLTSTQRFLIGLIAPGGVLVAAAWALQKDVVIRDAAAPYTAYLTFGAVAAAILLCWYHDQSRLLSGALVLGLTLAAFERWPHEAYHAKMAAVVLLPLNFAFFGILRENGVISIEGAIKLGAVTAQAAAIGWIGRGVPAVATAALPALTYVSFAIATCALLMLVLRRRTKVEEGLLWTLVAMFLAVNATFRGEELRFYASAAGLVLVLTVLDHGYDIAYRDELTGLLGRRGFNSMTGQLARTYAVAMCDVDHFKKFNDTYGHDVGDQVLRMVAACLSQVGGGGKVFRYGGEEFLVVFRGRTAIEAAPFVEAVRQEIAERGFVIRSANRPAKRPAKKVPTDAQQPRKTIPITVSIGLAERSQRHSTPELVLDAADGAMYRAKEAGRNCLRIADSTQNVITS